MLVRNTDTIHALAPCTAHSHTIMKSQIMLPGYCYCILDILYSNHVVVIGFYRNNFLYKSWQSSQFAKNCPVMCFSSSSSVRISVSALEMQFNAMEHVPPPPMTRARRSWLDVTDIWIIIPVKQCSVLWLWRKHTATSPAPAHNKISLHNQSLAHV